MKPAALLLAVGGGVVAVAFGIFVFSDQLGLGGKMNAENPALSQDVVPAVTKGQSATPSKADAPAPSEDAAKAQTPVASETQADSETKKEPAAVASDTEKNSVEDPQPTASPKMDNNPTPEEEAEPQVDAKVAAVEEAEAAAPSFDIVRVEPNGETLVAGRASPGWQVDLQNGEDVIASAVADDNGDWVMILDEALEKGVSDLSLSAKSEDGTSSVASTSNVTVALPEDDSGELLVIETAPGEASKVLAKLAQPKAEMPKPEMPNETPKEMANAASSEPSESVTNVAPESEESVSEQVPEQAPEQMQEAQASKEVPAATAVAREPVVASQNTEAKDAEDIKSEVPMGPASETTETAEAEVPSEQPVAETPSETSVTPKAEEKKPAPAAIETLVSIEAVEIEGDILFIAGAAEPAGSIVRLYVDNAPVSDQRSGETGRYLFDGKLKLEPGEHRARVDLLNTQDGSVSKRAEVIFNKKSPNPVVTAQAPKAETKAGAEVPAEAQPEASSDASKPSQPAVGEPAATDVATTEVPDVLTTKKVIIRRGDNLWEIARRVYGAGIRFSTIYDTNAEQIRDPHWIYPGQVFDLPEGEEGWEHNFDAVESPPVEEVEASIAPGEAEPSVN